MGNLISVIGGVLAMILGLIGLIFWWDSFFILLQGALPFLLALGGLISVMAGLSELKAATGEKEK